MPAVITRGLPETFNLEELDPKGETYITVKPATVSENAERDELWAKQTRTYNMNSPAAVSITSESTYSQRQALEVFLTMIDCNIEYQDIDAKGEPKGEPKPLFKFKEKGGQSELAMVRPDFLIAWSKLPQEVADELHSKVLLKNPQWDMFRASE